jgi:hypothetical protein
MSDGNTIDDLRTHLFETLRALRDPNKPMELERAKTIAEVAQTVINSAKVEVDFLRLRGEDGGDSKFLGHQEEQKQPALPAGLTGIITHKLRG